MIIYLDEYFKLLLVQPRFHSPSSVTYSDSASRNSNTLKQCWKSYSNVTSLSTKLQMSSVFFLVIVTSTVCVVPDATRMLVIVITSTICYQSHRLQFSIILDLCQILRIIRMFHFCLPQKFHILRHGSSLSHTCPLLRRIRI